MYCEWEDEGGLGQVRRRRRRGRGKKGRKRRKRAIRRALRTGTALPAGASARLVAKLRAKRAQKAIPRAPRELPAILALKRKAEAERAARHAARVEAGTTRKQIKRRAETARVQRREVRKAAGMTRKQLKEAGVPKERIAEAQAAGADVVYGPAPPVTDPGGAPLPDVAPPSGPSTYGGSPIYRRPPAEPQYDEDGAPVGGGLPAWLIPAAIGAATFLL